jgi:hypothetical protein
LGSKLFGFQLYRREESSATLHARICIKNGIFTWMTARWEAEQYNERFRSTSWFSAITDFD